MTEIHPTAIVENGAEIGKDVIIEPYAIVKQNVVVHDKCIIKSHAYIDGYTTLGEGTTVWPSASIGTQTQDKKFQGEQTFVKIGKNSHIREFVTINASCQEGSVVEIGEECLLMAYCHVAHNCKVGNHVTMANNAMLAGHVIVEDHVTIGGMTPVHQRVKIGKYSMVGGFSRVTHDVPPFTIGAGYIYKLGGLNLVGLKRNGFSLELRQEISKAFRLTYRMGLSLKDALDRIEQELHQHEEIKQWVQFCRNSQRGLSGIEDDLKTLESTSLENLPTPSLT